VNNTIIKKQGSGHQVLHSM
jgi:hypothetical protein